MSTYGSSNDKTAAATLSSVEDGLAAVGRQIERLAAAAGKVSFPDVPKVFAPDAENGLRYGIVEKDGTITWVDVQAPPRRSNADTVQDLADLIAHLVPDGGTADSGGEKAEAYVRCAVGCKKLQRGDQRDQETRLLEDAFASLKIETVLHPVSDERMAERAFLDYDIGGTLRALEWLRVQRPWLSQRELIDLLRTELGMDGSALLRSVRSIETVAGADGQSKIEHQTDSLGVKAVSSIKSEHGPLPESVVVRFAALPGLVLGTFEDKPISCDVECTLQVNAAKALFRLVPKPGEVETAVRKISLEVAAALRTRANDFGAVGQDGNARSNRLAVFCGDAPAGVDAK